MHWKEVKYKRGEKDVVCLKGRKNGICFTIRPLSEGGYHAISIDTKTDQENGITFMHDLERLKIHCENSTN